MNRNNNDVERKEILCNFLCLYSQMTKAMSSTIKIEDLSQDNLSNIILDFSYFSHKVSLSETNSTRRCGLWSYISWRGLTQLGKSSAPLIEIGVIQESHWSSGKTGEEREVVW